MVKRKTIKCSRGSPRTSASCWGVKRSRTPQFGDKWAMDKISHPNFLFHRSPLQWTRHTKGLWNTHRPPPLPLWKLQNPSVLNSKLEFQHYLYNEYWTIGKESSNIKKMLLQNTLYSEARAIKSTPGHMIQKEKVFDICEIIILITTAKVLTLW